MDTFINKLHKAGHRLTGFIKTYLKTFRMQYRKGEVEIDE